MRVGVIGLGEVAQIIHLPILESLSGQFKLVALCDVSPSLLEVMGERYGVADDARYLDYNDLAADHRVDVVFVLNSDEYHADCAIAAMRHGKHVLVEKPMCLSVMEAERLIEERDAAGVRLMVGYMRRYAPAFVQAVQLVREMPRINYVRVRDIIGRNRLIIDQMTPVIRPDDVPADLAKDRQLRAARLVAEAIGPSTPELTRSYRLLCGLNSHDLSAMRELIGVPRQVIAASQWNGGNFLHVVMDYGNFKAVLETGVDDQVRFDAHIEIYGERSSVRIQYDTPYVRHLPTRLFTSETNGAEYIEREVRPTFKDPYTWEMEQFHAAITTGAEIKTTAEDFTEDLMLFKQIIAAIRHPGHVPQDT